MMITTTETETEITTATTSMETKRTHHLKNVGGYMVYDVNENS